MNYSISNLIDDIMVNGTNIPKVDFETVDEEIKPLVLKINKLPFVFKTLFSCAGYGKAGETPKKRPRGNYHKDNPTGHIPNSLGEWCGYLYIVYSGEKWKQFHGNLSVNSDSVYEISEDNKKMHGFAGPNFSAFTYHIISGVNQSTPEKLIQKWKAIDSLVSHMLQTKKGEQ